MSATAPAPRLSGHFAPVPGEFTNHDLPVTGAHPPTDACHHCRGHTQKPPPRFPGARVLPAGWCARGELNPHALSGTGT
jgi:hypothetical protein